MILPPICGAIQTFRDGLEFRYVCSFLGLAGESVQIPGRVRVRFCSLFSIIIFSSVSRCKLSAIPEHCLKCYEISITFSSQTVTQNNCGKNILELKELWDKKNVNFRMDLEQIWHLCFQEFQVIFLENLRRKLQRTCFENITFAVFTFSFFRKFGPWSSSVTNSKCDVGEDDDPMKSKMSSFVCVPAVGVGSWCFHMTLLYEMQVTVISFTSTGTMDRKTLNL